MQKHLLLSIIIGLCVAGCAQPQPAPAQPEPEFRMTATVRDIMDAIVDPGADYIWESVETVVSAKGVVEKMPRTDEEWKNVRRHAIMLLEATNLLQMPGRAVARPGEKADDPQFEQSPEQIQAMINKDRASWDKYALALHDATLEVLKHIDAKSAEGLLSTSDKIDTACESCHMHYWYPEDKGPPAASQKSEN
jgi:hypothetical protein